MTDVNEKFSMSRFATKQDREDAMLAEIQRLREQLDEMVDVLGDVLETHGYQTEFGDEAYDRAVAVLDKVVGK
jgi:hypothetical protein